MSGVRPGGRPVWLAAAFLVLVFWGMGFSVSTGSASVDQDGSRLKQIALVLAQAGQIAKSKGVHSLNVDTFLLSNGFEQIEADDVIRFLPGFTMRRPLTLVHFSPDGKGSFRQYEGNGNRAQFKQITWWRSRMGICYQVGAEGDGPGRNCAIFYKIDSTVVVLGIDVYGLLDGPGKAQFFKGDRTDITSWGAALRLAN